MGSVLFGRTSFTIMPHCNHRSDFGAACFLVVGMTDGFIAAVKIVKKIAALPTGTGGDYSHRQEPVLCSVLRQS